MKFLLRSDDGSHRQATWLELFFDLAFVIAVASLSHFLMEHPAWPSLLIYVLLFVPTWWVWNQFTWYASHFDNDDVFFRLWIFCSILGALFLASGLDEFVKGNTNQFVLSYVFLHLLMLLGWFRAYKHTVGFRPYIRFKIIGVALGIIFWGSSLFFQPDLKYILWFVGTILQLLMPVIAWKTATKMISVHYHHLVERHGLFAIIILGESLLSLTHARGIHDVFYIFKLTSCFAIVVSLWWIYFDWKYKPIILNQTGAAFAFNYGHLFLYVSLGMTAAGIGFILDGFHLAPQSNNLSIGHLLLAGGPAVFLSSLLFMNLLSSRDRTWFRSSILFSAVTLLALQMHFFSGGSLTYAGGIAITLISVIAFERLRV